MLRARLIDVEQIGDDGRIPDKSDLRAGFVKGKALQSAPGGVPMTTWGLIGAALLVGVFVFKKFI